MPAVHSLTSVAELVGLATNTESPQYVWPATYEGTVVSIALIIDCMT